jgi:hypothetical protein
MKFRRRRSKNTGENRRASYRFFSLAHTRRFPEHHRTADTHRSQFAKGSNNPFYRIEREELFAPPLRWALFDFYRTVIFLPIAMLRAIKAGLDVSPGRGDDTGGSGFKDRHVCRRQSRNIRLSRKLTSSELL